MTVKQFLTKCGINVDQLPPVAVNFGNHLHVQNSDLNNSHNKSVSADSDQGEDDDSIGDYVSKYFSKKLTQQQIAHTTTTQT